MAYGVFVYKKESRSSFVRLSYKPKIKKSQIEKIVGQEWEHKKLTRKQIKDLGLGVLFDVFGGSVECCLYDGLRSFYPDYCLGCFDADRKLMFYSRIYFCDEKKIREVLPLGNDGKLLHSYDFEPSYLSLLGANHLENFKDNSYHFKIFKSHLLPLLRFSIQVYDSLDDDLDVILYQFDFDMKFDEISHLVDLEEGEKKIKSLYEETLIRDKELHLFGAEHLLAFNQADVKYFLVQNFK